MDTQNPRLLSSIEWAHTTAETAEIVKPETCRDLQTRDHAQFAQSFLGRC